MCEKQIHADKIRNECPEVLTNRQRHLRQYERQLNPERSPQNPNLLVPCPEPLILGADEHGRDDIAGDEQRQERVVLAVVPPRVEDGQQDQASAARDRRDAGEDRERLLRPRRVGREAAPVPQPALGQEGEVQEHDGGGGHGDEEGLELLGADVGYVAVRRAC